jgi:uncharacterized protein (DUF1697 family)
MAQVVLLKGVNVGGHRTIRPSALAQDLEDFEVVNVGAAGTLVVRKTVRFEELRAEIERRLPFRSDVMICRGSDILRLVSRDPFAGHVSSPEVVRFVSVMGRTRRPLAPLPLDLPGEGAWFLRVLACQNRFILGLHRRHMKAIRYLGELERVVGVPITTRSWSTILAVAAVLEA